MAMRDWRSRHPKSRATMLAAVVSVGVLVLLAFVLVGVGRIVGGDDNDERAPAPLLNSPTPTSPRTAGSGIGDGEVAGPNPLARTNDADEYAAAIASAMFGMDYANYEAADYERLLTDALWPEIAAGDRNRLKTAISRRIPTADIWEQMRSIDQEADFKVEQVWEPRTGREGRMDGWWPRGVVLRNVSGTQTETWRAPNQRRQTSTHEVTVTIGVACPPAVSPCRLVSVQPNVES